MFFADYLFNFGGGAGGGSCHPSHNEVGQIINLSRAKIGGNNFKKKTYAI